MAEPRPYDTAAPAAAALHLRCGCELSFQADREANAYLLLTPPSHAGQIIGESRLEIEPAQQLRTSTDAFGNTMHRLRLQRGFNRVRSDFIARVPADPEPWGESALGRPAEAMPDALLRFLLPSRYCDSDRLGGFAQEKFGDYSCDVARVRAICDWTHRNIEYRTGSGSSTTSASDIVAQGWGVCRDFAHVAVALTRCCNIPARYVTGYLPEIGVFDPGNPNDFHAYFQAWLGGEWHTFDARFNNARIGRVHLATGLDAVDAAFLTTLCGVTWERFEVWGYQVSPLHATLSRPVDLADRLCGTTEVRWL